MNPRVEAEAAGSPESVDPFTLQSESFLGIGFPLDGCYEPSATGVVVPFVEVSIDLSVATTVHLVEMVSDSVSECDTGLSDILF